jgi:hypothetical protein
MIEICREHSKNVKRWRRGMMALRGARPGYSKPVTKLRRVNGHLHLLKLRAALNSYFTENVSACTISRLATGLVDGWNASPDHTRGHGHPRRPCIGPACGTCPRNSWR